MGNSELQIDIQEYIQLLNSYSSTQLSPSKPTELYAPIQFALENAGKGLRPVLVLMACDMVDGDLSKALPAALAIEWFHNFTLIHDDIMDDAPTRRGKPSVYKQFGMNSAILSGDALLIQAYQQLQKVPSAYLEPVFEMFNTTAIGVCEGQQFDMNFEVLDAISEADYLNMIGLKTAVLLAAAVYIGSRIGGASESESRAMYDATYKIGVAFQIQDDILDSFGDPEKFGKQKAGDIIQNKKTILLIHALQTANSNDKALLDACLNNTFMQSDKIEHVLKVYENCGTKAYAESKRDKLFEAGIAEIRTLCKQESHFNRFYAFCYWLMHRDV